MAAMASSMSCMRFVAPSTQILDGTPAAFEDVNPSQSVINSALTIPLASCSLLRRVPSTASISSMKMMAGSSFRAREKTALTSLFESPYHFSVSVEMWRLMKEAPLSCATAFASIVLPQPGGPYSSTPEGAESSGAACEYRCGIVSG
ncbi:hypothetical protein SLS63_004488 [Diaporthe eres]|uniref:Uncharacterized protein n=1 Tax=Diaporthe eres TaxID=83184 RepID=A0ABR1PE63_DIAER